MAYYKEEIEKDTKYRSEYKSSIDTFLACSRNKMNQDRKDYVDPLKMANNQEKYRKDFIDMLGYPLNTERKETKLISKEFIAKDNNVNIYRMQLLIDNTIKAYGILFEQINKKNNSLVLALHGGEGTPELVSSIHMDFANYNHLARRLTDKGFNVFCPQLLLWSVTNYGNPYDRQQVNYKMRSLGGTTVALEMYMMSSCLDYLFVNYNFRKDNLAVAGLSYGGMYSFFMAAYDTRIKACFSCSYLTDDDGSSLYDWHNLKDASMIGPSEIGGLIAPRALFIAMGDHDELFDSTRTEKSCSNIKEYYKAFNKENYFKYHIFNGVHETDKDNAWIDFIIEHTK